MSIESLVSHAGSVGLERALEEQLIDSAPLAFRVAYAVLRHRADAEDVAQEALARAYRKLGRLRERDRLRGWLVRICWRLALDHRRALKRRERREQSAAGARATLDPEALAAGNEFRERLFAAIDELPRNSGS